MLIPTLIVLNVIAALVWLWSRHVQRQRLLRELRAEADRTHAFYEWRRRTRAA